MAGFIFSISSQEGIEGVKQCIKDGVYASIVPNENLDNQDEKTSKSGRGKQVAVSVLADYCSMKTGDNVYFLSKRQIYGVGKLVNIGSDCKYKNYISAHELRYKKEYNENDKPIKMLKPSYRWICFFEPEKQFFSRGVDMDEVLMYKPAAFRMLRAFQDATFIKIDDEENRALKECIYLKNRENKDNFEYSSVEHTRIAKMDLEKYRIDLKEVIALEYNVETREANLEMLVEAYIVNELSKGPFEDVKYDYVTHQVIASPFKPLAYVDKMDVFAYKYLEEYPDLQKPIEKYLVVEVKKSKANEELLLQLMRYVDWISKEYAAGDYSKIKAIGIASGYKRNIQKVMDEECVRSYLSDTHPNRTSKWNDLTLYEYMIKEDGKLELQLSDTFNCNDELKKQLESIGIKMSTGVITIDSVKFKPKFKVQKYKWAFFEAITELEKNKLETSGWNVVVMDKLKCKDDVRKLVKNLFG